MCMRDLIIMTRLVLPPYPSFSFIALISNNIMYDIVPPRVDEDNVINSFPQPVTSVCRTAVIIGTMKAKIAYYICTLLPQPYTSSYESSSTTSSSLLSSSPSSRPNCLHLPLHLPLDEDPNERRHRLDSARAGTFDGQQWPVE